MEDDDVEKEEDNDVEEDDVEEEGRLIPRPGPPLCASLRSRKDVQISQEPLLIRTFAGKMPQPRVSTLIKHRPSLLLKEPLSVDTLFGEKSPRFKKPSN